MKKSRTRTAKTIRRPKRTMSALVKAKQTRGQTYVFKPRQQESSVSVYLASLGTDKSRASIFDALKRVIRVLDFRGPDKELVTPFEFPWEKIRYRHMQAIRSRLGAACQPSTANHALAAVRGVLEVAWNQRKITTEDYQRARSVKGVRGSRGKAGRHIHPDEIKKLFNACGAGVSGTRNLAILSLLYGAGLRRSEVAGAQLEDVNIKQKWIRVIGKGNKERKIYLPPGTVKSLKRWIKKRGDTAGPLVVAISKHGTLSDRGVSDEAIRKVVERVEKWAQVEHLSPHDFRRTYISNLLDAGADIATVQRLAGHSSPVTTSRYDRRGDRTRKRAANLLHVPVPTRKKLEETLAARKGRKSKEKEDPGPDGEDGGNS